MKFKYVRHPYATAIERGTIKGNASRGDVFEAACFNFSPGAASNGGTLPRFTLRVCACIDSTLRFVKWFGPPRATIRFYETAW